MGKKAKERKQTQVSPDYISASAGNSGILRDMAGHFAGTGRYVVPTITAACAMQGTVMPVCQVQAAAVTPADSVTIGSGYSMSIPNAATSAVDSITINGGGSIEVGISGKVTSATVAGGSMGLFGGMASHTLLSGGSIMVSYSGSVASDTTISGGTMTVNAGCIASDTYISGYANMIVYGEAINTVVDTSAGELMVNTGATVNNTTVNTGNMVLNSGSTAVDTIVNISGYVGVNDATLSGTYVNGINASSTEAGVVTLWGSSIASNTTINGGSMLVYDDSKAIDTIVNSGGILDVRLANSGACVASNTTVNSGGSITIVINGSATGTAIDGGSMLISQGGRVTDTIIDLDGTMMLFDGSANETTVNNGLMIVSSGGQGVSSGGRANSTTIHNAGSMTLVGGGFASNTVVEGGSLTVSSGGLATITQVDNGGAMTLEGGTASNTMVNSGTLAVTSGGSADITTIHSNGSMTVADGFATNTTVSGGSLTVSSGGLATSTTVDNGGAMTLAEGTASNTTVNSGTMAVTSGGSADITTVNSNGSMTLTSGTATSTTVNGGSLTVSAGGMASDNIIDLDGTMMVVGGSASNTIVNSGGALAVSAGGLATSTTVDSGGSMTVSSGGAASSTDIINGGFVTVDGGSVTDTAISSGIMEVISSGLATNTTVYNGGSLSVTGNSTVNNVVLSGGSFTNPTAGTNAFISGTVSGEGNITGPGDFTIANGNILLNSGSISTTGKLTIDKVLATTKPAVSATTINVGGVDVTNLDTDTSTGGTLLAADTGLAGVNLISGTTNAVLSSNGQNVTFDGAAYTDTSIPGFTLDYKDPPVTYSLVNSAKEVEYSITGNKQATKLTFGSIGWLDSGAFINHTNQFADIVFSGADVDTSKIHFNNVDSLQANKTMTLVSDFGNTVGKITGTKYTVGTTLQGNGKAQLVGNDLVYKVETDSVTMSPKTVAQEQTHNTLMGMEAGLAVINSGQEFIEKAVDGFGDINNIGNDGIAVYAGMGVSKDRYETGSHINLNTWNGIIGVGKANELPDGKIQWGGFLEHGSGNFSIHSDINSRGDGSSTYTGGGVVAKWTNKHDVYTEAGLRYGRSHDNASNVLQDALGKTYGYDVRANYYGGYLGVGKIYRLGKDRTLDVYGKFFSTHRDGVSFDAGGRYELDALQSNILRVGAKYGVKSGKVNWYGGLAYEHEFSGEATGKADGLPIRSASIKGGSLRLDFGATIKPSEKSPWTMRMGITGHTGKHRGIGGNFMLSYNF